MELYHILNRGVDKRKVFMDKQDHYRFVHDLFEFNDQNPAADNNYYFKKSLDVRRTKIQPRQKRKLLVKLHAFCMMPNHYHLLLSPTVEDGIPLFMKKLGGGYAKYFNEKYERSGALWQGKYKSVYIDNEPHFLYLPYYIHFNPLDLKFPEWRDGKLRSTRAAKEFLREYRWSSHLDYLGEQNFPSVTQREFLSEPLNIGKDYKHNTAKMLKNFDTSVVDEIVLE